MDFDPFCGQLSSGQAYVDGAADALQSEHTVLSTNHDLDGRLDPGVTRSAAPHFLPRAVDYLTTRIKTQCLKQENLT